MTNMFDVEELCEEVFWLTRDKVVMMGSNAGSAGTHISIAEKSLGCINI